MITYRATLDVPRELVWYVSRLLVAERVRRRTPDGSRCLTPFRQAVMGLRWFRDGTDKQALARDHGVSRATGYRYLDEVVAVLAATAPQLGDALAQAAAGGAAYVILDGKTFSGDACREAATSVKGEQIDVWYSGKSHRHGANIQAVALPDGTPIWTSDGEPASTHDLTAAARHALPALYRAAATGLPTLADAGYQGAGIGIHVPIPRPAGNQLDPNSRTRNALLRSMRCLGERAFALLTGHWRALRHIHASPSKISDIIKAALALTQHQKPNR